MASKTLDSDVPPLKIIPAGTLVNVNRRRRIQHTQKSFSTISAFMSPRSLATTVNKSARSAAGQRATSSMNSCLLDEVGRADSANDVCNPARRVTGILEKLPPLLGGKTAAKPGDHRVVDRVNAEVSKGLEDGCTDRIADRQFLRGDVLHGEYLVADLDLTGPSIRKVDVLGRHLSGKAEPVCRKRAGWRNAAARLPSQRGGNLVGRGTDDDAQPWVGLGIIVEPASQSLECAIPGEARECLIDGRPAAEMSEVFARIDLAAAAVSEMVEDYVLHIVHGWQHFVSVNHTRFPDEVNHFGFPSRATSTAYCCPDASIPEQARV